MKRFGSIFPFLEQGRRHAHIGRLVANEAFAQALLQHGHFDECVFGSPSRSNLAEFREAVGAWLSGRSSPRVRYLDLADWPSLLRGTAFHVMHLGGWGYFMPGLHYLRTQLAPRPWPITGIIHSLHGRETIDHAVRLASAELLPCDAVFCTSRDGRLALERLLDGAAAIVGRRFAGQLIDAPLGIDDGLLETRGDRQHARARLRIPEDAVVLLVLGRMSVAQKCDPTPLCRAFANDVLPHSSVPAVLVFAGGAAPADLEMLRETVRRHGLEPHVRLHPNFAPDQKRDVLAMADILVAPTDNVQETFGLSLLEAQAAGLPVVASRYDGYKDLVADGVDGFLIDTYRAPENALGDWFDVMDGTVAQLLAAQGIVIDVDQLADRLSRLIGDASLRRTMGEAGRAKVDRQYRWSRVVRAYEDVWDRLAREAARLPAPPPALNPYALNPSSVFAHYPSHELERDTVVVATARDVDEMPYRETAAWLAPPLLVRLLRAAARPLTIGDLLAETDAPSGQSWFAVAWLLKYGLLRGVRRASAAGAPEGTDSAS